MFRPMKSRSDSVSSPLPAGEGLGDEKLLLALPSPYRTEVQGGEPINDSCESRRGESRPKLARSKRDLLACIAQRLDPDHAGIRLVFADDQREARAARVGTFHLRAEVSAAGVHGNREAGVAQTFRDLEGEHRRAFPDVNDVCVGCIERGPAVVLQQRQNALDADAEAAARRRLAAELRKQTVVSTAGTYRALRAEARRHPFVDRRVVVVEAADQPRVDAIFDACLPHAVLHGFKYRA